MHADKALTESLGIESLEDGSVIQVRVMSSSDELFSVTKSFGQLVVREGGNENADITLWIDRDLIVHALETDNPLVYVQTHATSVNVRVELHKNLVILQKKGYTQLYESLKR